MLQGLGNFTARGLGGGREHPAIISGSVEVRTYLGAMLGCSD